MIAALALSSLGTHVQCSKIVPRSHLICLPKQSQLWQLFCVSCTALFKHLLLLTLKVGFGPRFNR